MDDFEAVLHARRRAQCRNSRREPGIALEQVVEHRIEWFPAGARSLALQGADILFYPTAIGWQTVGQEELGKAEYEAWETVQRGHAISNTVFVAATNRTGREDHLNFWGGSFVSDPLGRVLKRASHDREENLIVKVDLAKIAEIRKDWPFLTCRRTEEYRL